MIAGFSTFLGYFFHANIFINISSCLMMGDTRLHIFRFVGEYYFLFKHQKDNLSPMACVTTSIIPSWATNAALFQYGRLAGASYAKSVEEFSQLVGGNMDSVSLITKENSKCYIVKKDTDLHIILTGSNDLLDFVQGSMVHMCDCRLRPLIDDDDENKTLESEYTFKIHSGFNQYYTQIRKEVANAVKAYLDDSSIPNDKKQLVFLGHSLGGTCVLPAFEAALMTNAPNIRVVTYGSPMVGNRLFAHTFADKVPDSVRVAIETDIVATNFPIWLGYMHVGQYTKHLPPTNSILFLIKTIQDHSHTRYVSKLRDFALDDLIL
jgi:hypothetical protein